MLYEYVHGCRYAGLAADMLITSEMFLSLFNCDKTQLPTPISAVVVNVILICDFSVALKGKP